MRAMTSPAGARRVPDVSDTLTLSQARRLAIAATGLGRPRAAGRVDRRHVRGVLRHTALFQIDSVSTVVRAHYLPLWSRLGAYDRSLLDRMYGELFEYWAHEASLLPVELHPLLRWRMAEARAYKGIYGGLARFAQEESGFVASVLERVRDEGPLAASDLGERGEGSWWGWSQSKRALEWLFWSGQVAVAARRSSFERVYDLPERVLPRSVLDLPTPEPTDAQRELIRIAARSLGVATASDLGDYFRLRAADTSVRVTELVESGELRPVAVRGWRQVAYVPPDTTLPRRVSSGALLAPFDPLVWERPRVARLWQLELRLEIYTPAHKRVHGYYVLPFLLGERIVARVDLKADRAAGILRVPAVHAEPDVDHENVAVALAAELVAMADWLGLDEVVLGGAGDLAPALLSALAAADRPDLAGQVRVSSG
jgi:uncharacterized protein YcaQ